MAQKSIKKNFLYQFGYQILAILLPVITSPYISRVLGAEGIGEYAYINTVSYYFYVFCMLGFDTYGQREIAAVQEDKENRSKIFSQIYFLQILISVLIVIGYVIYAFQLTGERKILSLIQTLYVTSSVINIIWLFEGIEEFRSITIRNTILRVFSVILIITLIHQRSDLWCYTLINAASTFLGNIFFITYSRRFVKPVKISFSDFRLLGHHLKKIFMLFIPQIAITIFMQTDKLMLGWWSPIRELGYYQNAEKLINIPVTLIFTVGTVIMPRIAKLKAEGNIEKVRSYNSLSMQFLLIIAFAGLFGIAAVADDFVTWFFGSDFAGSESIVIALTITIIFHAWCNVVQKQFLIPYAKDRIVIIATSTVAIVNVILNIIFIPKYNAMGAIIGSVISLFLLALIESLASIKVLSIFRYLGYALIYGIAGFIMFVFVSILSRFLPVTNVTFRLIIEIMSGVIFYILLIVIILALAKNELSFYLSNLIKTRLHLNKVKNNG